MIARAQKCVCILLYGSFLLLCGSFAPIQEAINYSSNARGKLCLHCRINDVPSTLLPDTGTPDVSLDKEHISALRKKADDARAEINWNDMHIYLNQSLNVRSRVYCLSLENLNRHRAATDSPHLHGLFGSVAIRNSDLVLDFGDSKICLGSDLKPEALEVQSTLSRVNDGYYTKVRVNETDYYFLIDTGAACSIIDSKYSGLLTNKTISTDSLASADDRVVQSIEGDLENCSILSSNPTVFRMRAIDLSDFKRFGTSINGTVCVGLIGVDILKSRKSIIWLNKNTIYAKKKQ